MVTKFINELYTLFPYFLIPFTANLLFSLLFETN